MGIGISSFTEIVGAGPSHDFDILGIKMFDSCEIRVHPTGKVLARIGVQTQGQGHETTFAQIIAEELGFPVADIKIEYGDTDTAPYGLGTYASRSTPVAGAATAIAARKIQDKARKIAAHLLEASEDDLEWTNGKFSVKGSPDRFKTIQEIAFAAYTNHPAGMEAGLEAVDYYDPPNLTFPFGSYICVVDIDKGTGQVNVRRFVAVDDCGNIINPMIVDGQIHGGLTMGLAPSLYEEIIYDELGNNLAGTFMDYLLPTAVETPAWEIGKTITPSPHHPIGAKGVGESATVGAPPAIANAVVDALWHLGVRNIDIPITPQKVWAILHEKGVSARLRWPGPSSHGPPSSRRPVGRSPSRRSWRSGGRPRPDPARPGIVHPDGSIEGWVGGSCAQPVVVREALRALADGQPRLLRLSKDGPAEGRRGDGVVELVMTCHSGGTLEIYVEPHLPAPHLWVAGTTPIAGALAAPRHGRRLAGDRHRPDRRGRRVPRGRPGPRRRPTSAASTPTASPYVVVASQGIWDEEAVGLALTPRGGVRRPRRHRRRGPRSSATGSARRRRSATSGSRRCGRRPVSISAPRRRRRSPSRSWPSSSRSAAAGRDFVASPGPATRGAGVLPHPVALEPVVDDIVLAGSGLRDDRRSGARPPPGRARRDRLRVLLDRLSDPVHQGAGGVPVGKRAVHRCSD